MTFDRIAQREQYKKNVKMKAEKLKCPSCGGGGSNGITGDCSKCGGSGEVADKEKPSVSEMLDTVCGCNMGDDCDICRKPKKEKPSMSAEERGYEIAKLAAEENGISFGEQLRLNAECEKIFKDVDFSSLRPYKPKEKPSVVDGACSKGFLHPNLRRCGNCTVTCSLRLGEEPDEEKPSEADEKKSLVGEEDDAVKAAEIYKRRKELAELADFIQGTVNPIDVEVILKLLDRDTIPVSVVDAMIQELEAEKAEHLKVIVSCLELKYYKSLFERSKEVLLIEEKQEELRGLLPDEGKKKEVKKK